MRNSQLLMVAAFLLFVPAALLAQQPTTPTQPMQMPMQPGQSMQMPMQQGQVPSGQMPADCQAMMQKMQAMHASAKAMDDRLETLVAEMNKARGSAKVDRMAAVINELVTQRKQMRTDMEAMMPQMMQHMMQHMQSGMMKGMMNGMQSMANCPMMSGASQAAQQPAAPEHKH